MAPWFSSAVPRPTMAVPPRTVSLGDGGCLNMRKLQLTFFTI